MPYKNISTGTTAVTEYETFTDKVTIHFAEWWNGEGGDFTIESKADGKQFISLSRDDMEQLCAMMLATGQVDLEDVRRIAKEYEGFAG